MPVRSPNRTLVVLDIENLNQGDNSRAAFADSLSYLRPYVGPSSLVWGACSHAFAQCIFEAPTWSWKLARGKDGADLNLLARFELEGLPADVGHVVIASGDHAFADLAAGLATVGVRTTVVARSNTLSKRLRMAAQGVLTLPTLADSLSRKEAA